MAFLVIYDFYDLLMICYCFLGVPLFFIDFPKEFQEIFDISLIFLKFFFEILDLFAYVHLFSEFSLGLSLKSKTIINKS